MLALVASLTLGAASGAVAAEAAKGRLDRNQLRLCMDREAELKHRKADYDRDAEALQQAVGEIDREDSRLTREQPTLDTTDADAVEAFNARIDAHRASLAGHNEQVGLVNERGAQLRHDQATLKADCGDRRFEKTDEAAILRERRKPVATPAAASAP